MKTKILDINGKEKGTIELPTCFSSEIREDIIAKVLEAKKQKQPYSPSPIAGKQHSASGKLIHRRHVWKSQYGRGMSRVPRKAMSNKGSQFNWVGAEVPNTRGGRRAHPPKVLGHINTRRINKKELAVALCSAISATANVKHIQDKYERIEKIESAPFVVESKISSLKAKQFLDSVKKILGKEIFEIAVKKKSVRSGRGTRRGRKYKSNAGLLIVIGKEDKFKTNAFDVVSANNVGVTDLAKGGVGRLTLYTENAIKELGEKIK